MGWSPCPGRSGSLLPPREPQQTWFLCSWRGPAREGGSQLTLSRLAWGPVMEPHWAPPAPGGAQSHSFWPLRGLRLEAACVLLSAHRLVPLALGLALPKGLNFPPSWAATLGPITKVTGAQELEGREWA